MSTDPAAHQPARSASAGTRHRSLAGASIHRAAIDFTVALSLIVMPWRLRAASRRMSPPMMIVAGAIGVWLVFGVMFGAALSGINEPWGRLIEYRSDLRFSLALMLKIAAIPALVMLLALPVVSPLPQRARPLLGLFVLWPMTLILPTLLWSCACVVNIAAEDVFDPNTPAWIEWPIWSFLGACHWPIMMLAAVGVYVAIDARRIYRLGLLRSGVCISCGYDVFHIPSDRCPECGTLVICRTL
jgi:hypothetical protein